MGSNHYRRDLWQASNWILTAADATLSSDGNMCVNLVAVIVLEDQRGIANLDVNLSVMFSDVLDADEWIKLYNS